MLKKIVLLPAMVALTLFVSGCEEGDFNEDAGAPDVQTEEPIETDADFEVTDETGFGEEEASQEGDQRAFEETPEARMEESEQRGLGGNTTTGDPVAVPQDVNVPENEGQSNQPQSESRQQSGSQSEDAVEEVPAESLPGNQGSGNNQ